MSDNSIETAIRLLFHYLKLILLFEDPEEAEYF